MANPLKMLKLKPTGFQMIQEIPIDAPPKKVWAAVLDPQNWFGFDPDHSKWAKHKFEPVPGGKWIMENQDGSSMLFATVTQVEPHKLLRLGGPVGLTHLPANSAFIFELQPKQDGKATLLRIGHRTFGFLTSDIKKNYAGGWKKLLPQIKALAEKK